jgi:hypothetical protein
VISDESGKYSSLDVLLLCEAAGADDRYCFSFGGKEEEEPVGAAEDALGILGRAWVGWTGVVCGVVVVVAVLGKASLGLVGEV